MECGVILGQIPVDKMCPAFQLPTVNTCRRSGKNMVVWVKYGRDANIIVYIYVSQIRSNFLLTVVTGNKEILVLMAPA